MRTTGVKGGGKGERRRGRESERADGWKDGKKAEEGKREGGRERGARSSLVTFPLVSSPPCNIYALSHRRHLCTAVCR